MQLEIFDELKRRKKRLYGQSPNNRPTGARAEGGKPKGGRKDERGRS